MNDIIISTSDVEGFWHIVGNDSLPKWFTEEMPEILCSGNVSLELKDRIKAWLIEKINLLDRYQDTGIPGEPSEGALVLFQGKVEEWFDCLAECGIFERHETFEGFRLSISALPLKKKNACDTGVPCFA